MPADPSGAFFEYHEPSIVGILTLISFFVLLNVFGWLSNRLLRAELIGQIAVGLIYGVPISGILALEWQEAFLALGYIGLLIVIFEGLNACCHASDPAPYPTTLSAHYSRLTCHFTALGGLTIRLDLLRQNLVLSIIAAVLGVLTPISLTFALLYAGFGHGTKNSPHSDSPATPPLAR